MYMQTHVILKNSSAQFLNQSSHYGYIQHHAINKKLFQNTLWALFITDKDYVSTYICNISVSRSLYI